MNHSMQVLRQVGKKFPHRHYRCLLGSSDNTDDVMLSFRDYLKSKRALDTTGSLHRHLFLHSGLHGHFSLNWSKILPHSHTHNPIQFYSHEKKIVNKYRCYHSEHKRSNSGQEDQTSAPSTIVTTHVDLKNSSAIMDKRLLFQYLQLKDFTTNEMNAVFDRILHSSSNKEINKDYLVMQSPPDVISKEHLTNFIFDRLKEIDVMQQECYAKILAQEEEEKLEEDKEHVKHLETNQMDPADKIKLMNIYAQSECSKAMGLFQKVGSKSALNSIECGNKDSDSITRHDFHAKLRILATEIDITRTIPIAVSMLLVGSSVGIIIPVMPYVVSNIGLSAGEFGMVISSFAVAKLLANLPAAILVERHGRKPYLVYSLVIISCGVGGIGFASQFEHLVLCRTLTGVGVSLLRTAATLSIADCSTSLNRARSMATMMSSFAAGMSLGPAVGGILADKIGLQSTFYLVGGIYLVLASINNFLLTETKVVPEKERVFPWHQNNVGRKRRRNQAGKGNEESVFTSMQSAVQQWRPLLENRNVRNVVVMNGFYWFALSGAQMTLLPLILTDPSGFALSPTSVGEIYMGMSLVQVFGNPTMAKYIDKIGKVPGIVTGCSILSASMFALPFCTDTNQVAYTLGFWALGSTMLSTAPTAFISDHVQDGQRAPAIALLRTAADVGLLVGASTTGAMADMFNMNVAVHSSASLLLLATGWFTARRLADWHQSKHLFK